MSNDIPVVVIEDEPEIRKFLSAVLTAHDFVPVFAETAKEGLVDSNFKCNTAVNPY